MTKTEQTFYTITRHRGLEGFYGFRWYDGRDCWSAQGGALFKQRETVVRHLMWLAADENCAGVNHKSTIGFKMRLAAGVLPSRLKRYRVRVVKIGAKGPGRAYNVPADRFYRQNKHLLQACIDRLVAAGYSFRN